jgi:uncharacterized protein (DUF2147 family)
MAVLLVVASRRSPGESTPAGLWKTIDDRTGQPRGFVRIYEEHGLLFGKIEGTVKPSEAKEHCRLCRDERRGQPVIGLVVIRSLKKQGEEYSGGDILDPENGTVYRCKLRLLDEGKRLLVRGYVVLPLFGRSQIWIRQP